ncbi:MAG: SH3 domain-containing protein [Peptostreptococcaceae bacterium]
MKKRIALATLALMPMSTALASGGQVGEVTASSLNVRSGPSTSNSVLFTVKKGEQVNISETSGGWYKITNSSGNTGWSSSNYITIVSNGSVELSQKKVVNVDALNMRSGASTSYRVITVLGRGTEVEIISESGGWSKVKVDGRLGYVATQYLTGTSSNNGGTVQKMVNASSLNIRSGPSTSHTVVARAARGELVNVVSESNGWSKIIYDSKELYVSSAYLKSLDTEAQPEVAPPTTTPPTTESTIPPVEENQNALVDSLSLNYSLSEHVSAQLDRVSVGGNVIAPSNVRSTNIQTMSFDTNIYQTTTESTINSVVESRMQTFSTGYIPASQADLEYYLNPSNFTTSEQGMMQFLRIDGYKDGITSSQLNSYLNALPGGSSNIFYNQGSVFIDAARSYNLDVAYLVSHAMWETGYGQSVLARGQTITSYKGQSLGAPVTVYNFFGIGAIDQTANVSGAEAAYSNGWTSIEKTIMGSAQWISQNYVNSSKYNQNTIYKMKFNYDYTWHQYATDVNWCNGISRIMHQVATMYDNQSSLKFEIPVYK